MKSIRGAQRRMKLREFLNASGEFCLYLLQCALVKCFCIGLGDVSEVQVRLIRILGRVEPTGKERIELELKIVGGCSTVEFFGLNYVGFKVYHFPVAVGILEKEISFASDDRCAIDHELETGFMEVMR